MALIIFDVDGTLKPYFHKIPNSTFKAIDSLKKAGHSIAIATGRSFSETKRIAELFNINYLICNGGSEVIVDGEWIYQDYLDNKYIQEISLSLKKQKVPYIIYNENNSYSTYFPKVIKFIIVFLSLLSFYLLKLSTLKTYVKMIKNVKVVNKHGDELVLIKKVFFLTYNKPLLSEKYEIRKKWFINTIEFECKEVGIICLMDKILEKKVIVFGDGNNDLSMFKLADESIAMGNAKEKLKNKASYITTKTHKDGIYKACEYFNYFKDF